MPDSWEQWVTSGAWLATDGQNLPLMPGLMRDALALGLAPDVTPHALIKRISTEQQLAARVLQLANLAASNGNPTPELRALSATIVEWWYTGVYTVGDDKRVATHTGALMWNAMSMPAPGTCAGPFGAWSRPPV